MPMYDIVCTEDGRHRETIILSYEEFDEIQENGGLKCSKCGSEARVAVDAKGIHIPENMRATGVNKKLDFSKSPSRKKHYW